MSRMHTTPARAPRRAKRFRATTTTRREPRPAPRRTGTRAGIVRAELAAWGS